MFEPFQRLDDVRPDGLGLGLAVARGLTEAIGGTLSAEDTPGGGLTIVARAPAGRTRPPTPRSPQEFVLVVDDEPAIRAPLAINLRAHD